MPTVPAIGSHLVRDLVATCTCPPMTGVLGP